MNQREECKESSWIVRCELSVGVHAFNSSAWEVEEGGSQFEASLVNIEKPSFEKEISPLPRVIAACLLCEWWLTNAILGGGRGDALESQATESSSVCMLATEPQPYESIPTFFLF